MRGASGEEFRIMKILWAEPETGLRFKEICNGYGGKASRQTINTYLIRLQAKGLIRAEGIAGKRQYIPTLTRCAYICEMIKDIYGDIDAEFFKEMKEELTK